MTLLDPEIAAKMGTLQLTDDAIAYRQSHLDQACPDCRPARRCHEHAVDEHLIASYQDRYAQALRDALTGIDPADIAEVVPPGDITALPTAEALSLLILARLRELAASGPAIIHLDGRPVVIELDGRSVIEHPLPPGTGDAA
jgi:hypothetical protein